MKIDYLDEFDWENAKVRAKAIEAGKKLGKVSLDTTADVTGVTTRFDGMIHLYDGTHIEIIGTKLLFSGSFHFLLPNGRTQFIHFGTIREIDIAT